MDTETRKAFKDLTDQIHMFSTAMDAQFVHMHEQFSLRSKEVDQRFDKVDQRFK